METRKLYYENCHLAQFTGRVVDCQASENGWLVELDQTAFYPEGGGQAADTGRLGGVKVLHVREAGERVLHLCDGPLEIGAEVAGTLDWGHRFDLMQQHTGEHIVSGLIHSCYGWHNTGFHMGAESTTIDFDGPIPPEDLQELEAAANRAVWQDMALKIWTPGPEELETVTYRSKRALPWPVRIVQVPGVDSCACCGVHVARTGEVGLVKLFSAVKFRGGTRIEMLCGRRALEYLNRSHSQNALVSRAFSAKLWETGAAAERMNELVGELKAKIAQLETQSFAGIAAECAGKGNVLVLRPGLDGTLIRKLADLIAQDCGGMAAVFSGGDETGWGYCLVEHGADLREFGRAMTRALDGRGGGKPEIQQGTVRADKGAVMAHFASFAILER